MTGNQGKDWSHVLVLKRTSRHYKFGVDSNISSGITDPQTQTKISIHYYDLEFGQGLVNIRTVIRVFIYLNQPNIYDHQHLRDKLKHSLAKKWRPLTLIPACWAIWLRIHMTTNGRSTSYWQFKDSNPWHVRRQYSGIKWLLDPTNMIWYVCSMKVIAGQL